MAGVKPNMFPVKSVPLDGTEELYTQTSGTSEKFTTAQLKQYVTTGTEMELCETIAYQVQEASIPYSPSTSPSISVGNFFIPQPNDLHPAANAIRVKVILGVLFEFENQSVAFEVKNVFSGVVGAASFLSPSDGWTEYVATEWFDPINYGIPVEVLVQNNVIDSPADIMAILETSILLIRAIKE